MTVRKTQVLAAVMAAAMMLAGCSSRPAPEPPTTASGEPQAQPTSSPTPEIETLELTVEAERFVVEDEAESVELEWSWADDPTTIVADLEAIFGTAATHEVRTGDGTHIADFDVYSWDGFLLGIARLDDGDREGYFLPSYIEVRSETVGPVSVRTSGGLGVGTPIEQLLAAEPPVQEPYYLGGTAYRLDPSKPELLGTEEPTRMVQLVTDPAESVVVSISAPALSFSPI